MIFMAEVKTLSCIVLNYHLDYLQLKFIIIHESVFRLIGLFSIDDRYNGILLADIYIAIYLMVFGDR